MIEDKLSARQRLRLECVAQANLRLDQRLSQSPKEAVQELLYAADRIEEWINSGPPRPPAGGA